MIRASIAVLLVVLAAPVGAQEVKVAAPPKIAAASHYLVDFSTDTVLASSNANEEVEPASLTKLSLGQLRAREPCQGRFLPRNLAGLGG